MRLPQWKRSVRGISGRLPAEVLKHTYMLRRITFAESLADEPRVKPNCDSGHD